MKPTPDVLFIGIDETNIVKYKEDARASLNDYFINLNPSVLVAVAATAARSTTAGVALSAAYSIFEAYRTYRKKKDKGFDNEEKFNRLKSSFQNIESIQSAKADKYNVYGSKPSKIGFYFKHPFKDLYIPENIYNDYIDREREMEISNFFINHGASKIKIYKSIKIDDVKKSSGNLNLTSDLLNMINEKSIALSKELLDKLIGENATLLDVLNGDRNEFSMKYDYKIEFKESSFSNKNKMSDYPHISSDFELKLRLLPVLNKKLKSFSLKISKESNRTTNATIELMEKSIMLEKSNSNKYIEKRLFEINFFDT